MTDVTPVFSLIDKESHRVTYSEIDSKPEVSLRCNGLQVFARVAKYETWRFALFVFFRDEAGENAVELELGGARPPFEFLH